MSLELAFPVTTGGEFSTPDPTSRKSDSRGDEAYHTVASGRNFPRSSRFRVEVSGEGVRIAGGENLFEQRACFSFRPLRERIEESEVKR